MLNIAFKSQLPQKESDIAEMGTLFLNHSAELKGWMNLRYLGFVQ